MKFRFKFLAVALLTYSCFSSAQEEAPVLRAGPTLAVQEANLKDGFRLSEKAKEVINVKLRALGPRPFNAPESALVYYGNKTGVYRIRDGWFKLIEVERSNSAKSVTISSPDLRDNDQIAAEGVALLRVSEMDAFGGEE